MKKACMLLFAILCAFCIFAAYYVKEKVFSDGILDAPANVLIEKGDGLKRVAFKLYQNGIISSPRLFEILVRVYEKAGALKAGEYRFEPKISMYEAMMQIADGRVYLRKVTLPEGLTAAQMLEIVDNTEFLTGNITEPVSEGQMLPETYTFSRGDSKDSVIRRAKAAMNEVLEQSWQNLSADAPLKSKDELLTLASIVEKETGLVSERGLVASVFLNRLKKGMMLQTDPTVIYAITKGKTELGRALRKKDLQIESPYNTYKNYGLPPTPICSPSKEALFAIVNPQKSDFLYFVATGSGGHNFAKTLDEHNKNVQQYIKKIKAQKQKEKKS